MTAVVDASVWVSLFWPDDHHHAESRGWIRARVATAEELLVPAIALPEVAGPIRRRTGRDDLATRAVEAMLEIPGLTVHPVDADLGEFAAGIAARLGLKGADAIYAALSLSEGVPLVSWDADHLIRCSALPPA